MSESLRDLLYRAEHGKMGKRGYVAPRNDWNFMSGYRDKTEKTEGGFKYYLWDYLLMEKRQGVLTLYSWDSATTQDRLDDIARFYHLPLYFTLHGGELYCKPLGWSKLDEEKSFLTLWTRCRTYTLTFAERKKRLKSLGNLQRIPLRISSSL